MEKQVKLMGNALMLLFLLSSLSSISVTLAGPGSSTTEAPTSENPFTPKASLIRYWNKQISNNLPKPNFLLSKASPLSTIENAIFTKLAAKHALNSHLSSFCSAANLLCSFDDENDTAKQALIPKSGDDPDANFAFYTNKHFSNYGASKISGADEFKNYSGGLNFAADSFARYSRSSTGHGEGFTSYSDDGNVAASNFTSYAADSTGGSGVFKTYDPRVNIPDLRFSSYDSDSNNHELSFSSYSDDTNSGNEKFTSYSKNGNGVPVDFTRYSDSSNVIGSGFTGYGESGNGANDSFKRYSSNSNKPSNNFKSYSLGGNSAIDEFSSYRDGANSGTDSFQSYAKNANAAESNFVNYGKSFNEGIDNFKEYGKGSIGSSVGFRSYGLNNTFKDYAHKGVTFAQYSNGSSSSTSNSIVVSGKSVIKLVASGKFFREIMMKEGTVMEIPDIRDRMPQRSFLPRVILSKLPFSSSRLSELKETFQAWDNSTMERVLVNALGECERGPSPGETKRCVGSVEDMIDFAVSVLGRNVVVRSTQNLNGSKQKVMIGKVNGINGGELTKSVSCHQSLYPYLLYYCHSVPKVRVYVADILDVGSRVKINSGVAICHIDTSSWSPGHGAFVALGSGPGLIEVCHWIFENDMTWTTAD